MRMFEKPLGMRDTLPSLYTSKRDVRDDMVKEIERWGYDMLATPTLEFYETVGVQSAILESQLFKLLDQQGQTLVLRPDMTAPIARVAASQLYKKMGPLRLAYGANVFRAQHHEGGRPAEFEQVGIELIGDGTTSADAEVIAIMVSTLQSVGLTHFKISIGHMQFIQALFEEILGNKERSTELMQFLYEKNVVGYREHVKSLPLSQIDKDRLLRVLTLRGGIEKAEEAMEIVDSEKGKRALVELQNLWKQLEAFQVESFVKLELNTVQHMSYYTGILFEVYAANVGSPVGNGGRYDELLRKFDCSAPATGFAIRLDRLLLALGKMGTTVRKYGIIFSEEQRMEAFEEAKKLRQDGKIVVLQNITGVPNVDQFVQEFEEVMYFLGKPRKEREK